jgi:Holliday junction DNA helicase RuvB
MKKIDPSAGRPRALLRRRLREGEKAGISLPPETTIVMKKNIPPVNSNIEDRNIDSALRPTSWDEYIGQEKIKNNLKVILEASKKRKEASDHLLFSGPAGLGKTTLAYLVARELGGMIKTTSGPAIEKAGDLAAILTNLNPGEVLFIDEAHRINPMIEEVLYPAMESRKLHLVVGKGPSARNATRRKSALETRPRLRTGTRQVNH